MLRPTQKKAVRMLQLHIKMMTSTPSLERCANVCTMHIAHTSAPPALPADSLSPGQARSRLAARLRHEDRDGRRLGVPGHPPAPRDAGPADGISREARPLEPTRVERL